MLQGLKADLRGLKKKANEGLRKASLASTSGVLKPLGDLERRKQTKVCPWDK